MSSDNIYEGDSFDATITTTNILPGTYLYYQLTGITADDLTVPSQRYGYVKIGPSGTFTIDNAATLKNSITESGILTFNLYTDPGLTSESLVSFVELVIYKYPNIMLTYQIRLSVKVNFYSNYYNTIRDS